jgi:transcriptional regulator with XRE-family HTH domain
MNDNDHAQTGTDSPESNQLAGLTESNIEIDRQESRVNIAARLRQAREQAGLSQGQVARLMNIHRPTISEIEAGRRRVTADEFTAMAKLYDVSVSWLVEGTNEEDLVSARYGLAARELAKLKPEDVELVLAMLAVFKKNRGDA